MVYSNGVHGLVFQVLMHVQEFMEFYNYCRNPKNGYTMFYISLSVRKYWCCEVYFALEIAGKLEEKSAKH